MKRNDLKVLIFDLDGTLTHSRSVISHKMTDALRAAEGLYEVVVISGAQRLQMLNQIPWLEDSLFTVMGQSGNDTMKGDEMIFRNLLRFEDIHSVFLHLADIHDEYNLGVGVGIDTTEVRGGQISWSRIGHNADKAEKKAYDPNGDIRREMLERVPFKNEEMMVKIGGTTCLDYTRNGWGKRGNIEKLLELNGWKKEDCMYIGDQLFKGGNDEEVMQLMETVAVNGPEQTLKVINSII